MCSEYANGASYLAADLSIRCYSREWTALAALSGLAVPVLYGFPVCILLIINEKIRRRELNRDDALERFGGLYAQYDAESLWWSVVGLFKVLLLTIAQVLLENQPHVQHWMMLMICVLALALHLFKRPFLRQSFNFLEGLLLVVAVLFIGAAPLFSWQKLGNRRSVLRAFAWVLSALFFACMAITLRIIMKDVREVATSHRAERHLRPLLKASERRRRRSADDAASPLSRSSFESRRAAKPTGLLATLKSRVDRQRSRLADVRAKVDGLFAKKQAPEGKRRSFFELVATKLRRRLDDLADDDDGAWLTELHHTLHGDALLQWASWAERASKTDARDVVDGTLTAMKKLDGFVAPAVADENVAAHYSLDGARRCRTSATASRRSGPRTSTTTPTSGSRPTSTTAGRRTARSSAPRARSSTAPASSRRRRRRPTPRTPSAAFSSLWTTRPTSRTSWTSPGTRSSASRRTWSTSATSGAWSTSAPGRSATASTTTTPSSSRARPSRRR